MPLDKAALGERYVCFECETRFYDLNRPEPTCPSCGVNQREEPEGGVVKEPAPAPVKESKPAAPKEEASGDSDTEELVDAILTKELDDSDEEEEDGGLSELGVPEMGEAEEESDD
jgi:hypothetical protein